MANTCSTCPNTVMNDIVVDINCDHESGVSRLGTILVVRFSFCDGDLVYRVRVSRTVFLILKLLLRQRVILVLGLLWKLSMKVT